MKILEIFASFKKNTSTKLKNLVQFDFSMIAEKIIVKEKEVCVIIEFDMLAYKKRTNSKSVKKTLSIPEWLNEEAMAANLNFSQILQEALREHLNLN